MSVGRLSFILFCGSSFFCLVMFHCFFFFFFFQAEDGIRDHCVTGVQTCALPISLGTASPSKQYTSSSACLSSLDTCTGVVAVPSVATAYPMPNCASATTSM